MDFGEIRQKGRTACLETGQRVEDHFVDIAEMIPGGRQCGAERRNVQCVGVCAIALAPYIPHRMQATAGS